MRELFAWLAFPSGSAKIRWRSHAAERPFSVGYATLRTLKISTSICFALLAFALVIAWRSPASGIEVSIYTATPPIFWIATIVGILNGVLLFYYGYERNNKIWLLGLFQIILCNFLIISLPVFRGYFFLGRFDSLSYLGYAKDIAIYGAIPDYNVYPMISMFLSSSAAITNLQIIEIARFVPAFFFAFYILSVFVWSRSISRDPTFVTSMMFASIPMFYAWFIASLFHHALAILMLPFFFYLLQRGKVGSPASGKFRVMMYPLVLLLTLMHPIVMVGFLIFLITILVFETYTMNAKKTVSVHLVLFSSVVFFSWVLQHGMMERTVRETVYQMLGMAQGATTFSSAVVSSSSLSMFEFLRQLLLFLSDDTIFYVLSIFAALVILRKSRWKTHPMTPTLACFVIGTIALGVMMVASMIHNPIRLLNLNFCIVLTIPLVGFLLYILRKQGRKKIARLASVLLIISFLTSILGVYVSPFTMSPTDMVTRSEVSGANWFTDERNPSIVPAKNVTILQTSPVRYSEMIYGYLAAINDPNIKGSVQQVSPPHFASILGSNQSGGGNYVFITAYDIAAYTEVWAESNRFNLTDFQALSHSSAIARVYDDGDVRVFVYS